MRRAQTEPVCLAGHKTSGSQKTLVGGVGATRDRRDSNRTVRNPVGCLLKRPAGCRFQGRCSLSQRQFVLRPPWPGKEGTHIGEIKLDDPAVARLGVRIEPKPHRTRDIFNH